MSRFTTKKRDTSKWVPTRIQKLENLTFLFGNDLFYLVPFTGGIPQCFTDCLLNISCIYICILVKEYSFAHQDFQSLLSLRMSQYHCVLQAVVLETWGRTPPKARTLQWIPVGGEEWRSLWKPFLHHQTTPRSEVHKCWLRHSLWLAMLDNSSPSSFSWQPGKGRG